MQKVRRHIFFYFWLIPRLLIRILIQVLFHQLSTCFSTFPSRYYPLSLNELYLALEDGPLIQTDSPPSYFLLKLYFIPLKR